MEKLSGIDQSVFIKEGYCHFRTPVSVRLDGGVLEIQITKDHSVTMSGPAETVFEGDVL